MSNNLGQIYGVGSTLHGAHWTGVYFGKIDAVRESHDGVAYWMAGRWFPQADTFDSRFAAVARQHVLAEQELQHRESIARA